MLRDWDLLVADRVHMGEGQNLRLYELRVWDVHSKLHLPLRILVHFPEGMTRLCPQKSV